MVVISEALDRVHFAYTENIYTTASTIFGVLLGPSLTWGDL